jgi:hypothetical protein
MVYFGQDGDKTIILTLNIPIYDREQFKNGC